jgi:hypothetical protein
MVVESVCMVVSLVAELSSALRGGLLHRMAAPRSFRRRLTWALVVGGVAVACGGKTTSLSGGTASLTGGTSTTTGGTANPSGGTSSGGVPSGGTATGGVSTGGTVTGGTATGGSSVGGSSTGGSATGGTAPVLCTTVTSLPAMGTACSTAGESQCDASGNRCICERGIWYCNNACPGSQPTPSTACQRGAACNYPPAVTCACVNLLWMCVGVSGCPDAANMPQTGAACNNLTGVLCDYPNANLAFHFACVCSANADASSGSTWTCMQSQFCPTTQPAYSLSDTCAGTAMCTYSTSPHHCLCIQSGTPWVCF